MAPLPRNLISTEKLAEHITHAGDILSRAVAGFSGPTTSSRSSPQLASRDTQMISIPNTYTDITDSPGIVVAIVFATVCGFVLVIWVIALIFNRRGMFPAGDTGTVVSSTETSVSFFSGSRRKHGRRPEVVEVHGRRSSGRVRDSEEFAEAYDEDEYESRPPSRRRSSGYRSVNTRRHGG